MKLTTLDKVLEALRTEGPVVTVDPEIRAKALRAVQRMVEVRPRDVSRPLRPPALPDRPGAAPTSATPATTCWSSAAASPD